MSNLLQAELIGATKSVMSVVLHISVDSDFFLQRLHSGVKTVTLLFEVVLCAHVRGLSEREASQPIDAGICAELGEVTLFRFEFLRSEPFHPVCLDLVV